MKTCMKAKERSRPELANSKLLQARTASSATKQLPEVEEKKNHSPQPAAEPANAAVDAMRIKEAEFAEAANDVMQAARDSRERLERMRMVLYAGWHQASMLEAAWRRSLEGGSRMLQRNHYHLWQRHLEQVTRHDQMLSEANHEVRAGVQHRQQSQQAVSNEQMWREAWQRAWSGMPGSEVEMPDIPEMPEMPVMPEMPALPPLPPCPPSSPLLPGLLPQYPVHDPAMPGAPFPFATSYLPTVPPFDSYLHFPRPWFSPTTPSLPYAHSSYSPIMMNHYPGAPYLPPNLHHPFPSTGAVELPANSDAKARHLTAVAEAAAARYHSIRAEGYARRLNDERMTWQRSGRAADHAVTGSAIGGRPMDFSPVRARVAKPPAAVHPSMDSAHLAFTALSSQLAAVQSRLDCLMTSGSRPITSPPDSAGSDYPARKLDSELRGAYTSVSGAGSSPQPARARQVDTGIVGRRE